MGIKGIFDNEQKLDDIERAILEKNKQIIIKKKAKVKDEKLDNKIKNFTNQQLKTLIKQDRKLLSKKKRVWKGKKGNFNNEALRGYFRKIDAGNLFQERSKYRNQKLND
mmetsp:Transcript_17145/g.15124  ORF Transcript_17145/g.15124 Transcript_17145/m.15124 type:complete len:109 (-) Transcript_17145:18-344(-)